MAGSVISVTRPEHGTRVFYLHEVIIEVESPSTIWFGAQQMLQ